VHPPEALVRLRLRLGLCFGLHHVLGLTDLVCGWMQKCSTGISAPDLSSHACCRSVESNLNPWLTGLKLVLMETSSCMNADSALEQSACSALA
jgi:hypothetical protein